MLERIENAMLVVTMQMVVYGTSGASFEGLLAWLGLDKTETRQQLPCFRCFTAADLLAMRKNMGKYGVNPSEVIYIVSQRGYYNLLEDAEFQDANLVGDRLLN
jgi:hypothetical protein